MSERHKITRKIRIQIKCPGIAAENTSKLANARQQIFFEINEKRLKNRWQNRISRESFFKYASFT